MRSNLRVERIALFGNVTFHISVAASLMTAKPISLSLTVRPQMSFFTIRPLDINDSVSDGGSGGYNCPGRRRKGGAAPGDGANFWG